MTAWYWTDSGQKRGPCSGEELKALAVRGLVTPETLVWQESYPTWFPAYKVRGLFEQPKKEAIQTRVLPALPHEMGSRSKTPASGAGVLISASSLADHNRFDFIADIRSVNFREEVVPIDATNLTKLLGNSAF